MAGTSENFSNQEFARRRSVINTELQQRGLDGLVVTAINNIPYVAGDTTGYLTNSGGTLGLTAVVVAGDEARLMVRTYEAESARWLAPDWVRVVPYSGDADDPRNPPDVLAQIIKDMGLGNSRIGLELDVPGLTPADLECLRRELPNAQFEDASDLIVSCSAVKSQEEIFVMEQAMATTEKAVDALAATLRVGVREWELAAQMFSAMVAAGSWYPIFQPFVTSGPRSALPHAVWSERIVQDGDSVFAELSGSVLRYHAPLIRTALVGSNKEVEGLYKVVVDALEAALDVIKPGVTTGTVDEACRGVIKRAGRSEMFLLRTGYQVGIDWVSRGSLSLMPGGKDELVPGMTFHVRPLLQDRGRRSVGCGETVLVTEKGFRCLSKGERRLIRR